MKTKKDAIRIILDDTKAFEKSLNYAVGYCDAAMLMEENTYEFEIQCLYILSNLSKWRHKEAKAVRNKLRERVQPCCNLIAPAAWWY
jgi:hypothetical protein